MAYKYENRYIKYNLTPILRQNRISLMWNKDSEKSNFNRLGLPQNVFI